MKRAASKAKLDEQALAAPKRTIEALMREQEARIMDAINKRLFLRATAKSSYMNAKFPSHSLLLLSSSL